MWWVKVGPVTCCLNSSRVEVVSGLTPQRQVDELTYYASANYVVGLQPASPACGAFFLKLNVEESKLQSSGFLFSQIWWTLNISRVQISPNLTIYFLGSLTIHRASAKTIRWTVLEIRELESDRCFSNYWLIDSKHAPSTEGIGEWCLKNTLKTPLDISYTNLSVNRTPAERQPSSQQIISNSYRLNPEKNTTWSQRTSVESKWFWGVDKQQIITSHE